jgi:capping protein alpha
MSTEVTEEEIAQICRSFLLQAPPGEFNEVVTDVRGLLQNDALLNRTALETFRKYNTEQMLQVGDHKQHLITKHGEVNPNEYVDPRAGLVLTFDHIKQSISSTRPISGELDNSMESLRKAFDDATEKYTKAHFQYGTSAVYASGGVVTLCIAATRFNPNNFWNGRWRSVWSVTIKGGEAKLEGNIRVNVHYFEDGNVQLTAHFKKNASVKTSSDPKSAAEAVLKQITKIEQDYHTALEHSYHTMGETTFKALRRVLPITRQKIDWNKIRAYKVTSEMK